MKQQLKTEQTQGAPDLSRASKAIPHVVIVGAGVGGLQVAKRLSKEAVRITLIDRRNHHLFQPLLYQVATADLSPSNIAVPIRPLFRNRRNVRVVLAEVKSVHASERRIRLADGSDLHYDYLVLATGAKTSYFGHDEWASDAPGLKSLEDAIEIRKRVLSVFEKAEQCDDPQEQEALLTFVVIGGGPTGVEMAGAIAEMAHITLKREFRRIVPSEARIILAEGGDRVLPGFHPSLSGYAKKTLEERGVDVRTGVFATAIDAHHVQLGDAVIEARTTVWAAGVAASPLARTLDTRLDRSGRIHVTDTLTIPEYAEIYVIGDMAHFEDKDGKPLPGVSPVAIQQGKHAAKNILRKLKGASPLPFNYWNKGSMATIGRNAAVADLRFFRCRGFPAWLAWLFLHIMYLVGFRNRVLTFFEWAYAYLSFHKGSRLITWDLNTPDKIENEQQQRDPLAS